MDSSALNKHLQEIESIKTKLKFINPSESELKNPLIDLTRLATLIDPSHSIKIYSHKKILGPILMGIRLFILKILYVIFKFDFNRMIEFNQNMWIVAQQVQALEKRLKILEEQQNNRGKEL